MSKNTDVIKNLVEGAIETEYEYVQDLNFTDMVGDEAAEYEEVEQKYSDLQEKLLNSIPDQYRKLLEEYFDAETDILCIKTQYMFNHGVKAGLSRLKYIREAMGESTVMIL